MAIENIGIPIIIFVIAISIIIYSLNKEEKRQYLNDKRYDDLANKFIDTIKKISDDNNDTIKNLTDSIHGVLDKFDEQKRDI